MLATLSANLSATFNRIITPKNKQEKIRENKIKDLISDIEHSKTEMKLAMDNFNNVTEPKLIDYYIYKLQSEQTRFEHLISEYKELYPTAEDIFSE